MFHDRRISAILGVLSLVSVTAALCCGPALGAAEPMPMDHSGEHSNHDDAQSCCLSHDTQALKDGPTLVLPTLASLDYVMESPNVGDHQGHSRAEQSGWPPGQNDLNSTLCTFLI
jgi:hypothetical protein